MPRLPNRFYDQLTEQPQSGTDYWMVSLRLRDGREVTDAAVIDGDIVILADPTPIQPEDIVDLRLPTGEWLAESQAGDVNRVRPRVGGPAIRGRPRPSPWAADARPNLGAEPPPSQASRPAIQQGAESWAAASRTVQRSTSRLALDRG